MNQVGTLKILKIMKELSHLGNLAAEWQITPSVLAYRYALSAEKVSSVILGVKNRTELLESLRC